MRLRLMISIVILGLSQMSSATTLHVTVVTASEIEMADRGMSFAGIQTRTDRSVERAVRLALHESQTTFAAFGIEVKTAQIDLVTDKPLREQLTETHPNALIILDIPKSIFSAVANTLSQMNRTTINVRHSDITLRDELCLQSLYHTIPSDRMYFDALAQFLVYRGWRKVLIVHGPEKDDKQRTLILERSLRKFGADVSDTREFTLSHHPDDRDKNQPEFLTGGIPYDVVAVVDTERDFGRYIQYQTRRARPVVGDVGLTPRGWHRTLERYGAPQLNERFRSFDLNQHLPPTEAMSDEEFAAWSAVKIITNNLDVLPHEVTASINPRAILDHPETHVDLYKGTRGSIRRWNHQLRQPILLATEDAVIAVAPMPKFLHPTHFVDTLGLDEPESACYLGKN